MQIFMADGQNAERFIPRIKNGMLCVTDSPLLIHGDAVTIEHSNQNFKFSQALQLPSAGPAAPPAAAPTRAAPSERIPPPPSTPPPASAPPSTKPAAARSARPALAPPGSLDPQTIERIKRERLLQDLRKRTAANGQYVI